MIDQAFIQGIRAYTIRVEPRPIASQSMTVISILLTASLQTGDTLTLEQALERARAARPQALVAAAVVARARGSHRIAGIVPNPTVQLDTYEEPPTSKVAVTQPLSWILRRSADRAAGRAAIDRARADSGLIVADLGREVRRSFYQAVAGAERLRNASALRAIADSLVRLVERRLTAGDVSALERDQVAQEAGRAMQLESVATEAARIGYSNLERAVAWSRPRRLVPTGALDAGLGGAGPARDTTLGMPPRLAGAIADSAAAAARLRSARLAQFPPLSFRGGQEWGGQGTTANVFVGFAIAAPLWSRGRELVAEAAGASAAAAGVAAEARLELDARLAEARIRLEETERRAVVARDSLVPASRRIRIGTVRLYEQGRTGILPVFDALRAEREVTQSMIDALLAFQEARAELIAILGRWE